MKIVTILGNRPQFIKHGLLSKRLRQEHEEIIIHTGQHYDDEMSAVFFRELDLPDPDMNLGIHGDSSYAQIGKMTWNLGCILETMKPDLVMVHGDTNSSLAGALAASKLHIPIAHTEAGARCGDKAIPEEMNRILVDQMSELLFCPTMFSWLNLNVIKSYFTGDVLYDTFLEYSRYVRPRPCDIFVTIHREDNVDNETNRWEILNTIHHLAQDNDIIFPIHPRVQKHLGIHPSSYMVKPMGYLETISHIQGAKLIITDSGGVQREAYFAGKPCIYIGTAGWPELNTQGGISVKANTEEILRGVEMMLSVPIHKGDIFGNGNAVEKIAEILSQWEKDN